MNELIQHFIEVNSSRITSMLESVIADVRKNPKNFGANYDASVHPETLGVLLEFTSLNGIPMFRVCVVTKTDNGTFVSYIDNGGASSYPLNDSQYYSWEQLNQNQ